MVVASPEEVTSQEQMGSYLRLHFNQALGVDTDNPAPRFAEYKRIMAVEVPIEVPQMIRVFAELRKWKENTEEGREFAFRQLVAETLSEGFLALKQVRELITGEMAGQLEKIVKEHLEDILSVAYKVATIGFKGAYRAEIPVTQEALFAELTAYFE